MIYLFIVIAVVISPGVIIVGVIEYDEARVKAKAIQLITKPINAVIESLEDTEATLDYSIETAKKINKDLSKLSGKVSMAMNLVTVPHQTTGEVFINDLEFPDTFTPSSSCNPCKEACFYIKDKGDLKINLQTGNVTLPENVSINAASKHFYHAVEDYTLDTLGKRKHWLKEIRTALEALESEQE